MVISVFRQRIPLGLVDEATGLLHLVAIYYAFDLKPTQEIPILNFLFHLVGAPNPGNLQGQLKVLAEKIVS